MSITLLHTADWQIGKQFANVPGDSGAALRLQRLETVATIARLARERQVDAVLVAGDLFDDNAVSDETLRRTMNALAPFEGPWVLLPGNHDAALAQSAWTRLRSLGVVPKNVVIADTAEPVSLCGGRLMLLPAPLRRRHDTRDLTAWFDDCNTDAGVFRVGLAHGAIANRLPEAAEAMNPIADDRARTARLDYLALGDWHGTLEVAEQSWYAGTPEPDRFKENESGNVLMVTLTAPGEPPRVERVPVGRYRWRREHFELTDERSPELLDERLRRLEDPGRTLLRLKLTGALSLAMRARLDRLLEAWRAELHFLEVDEAGLLARPVAEDIDELGATGFVRDAVETLQQIEADEAHPDRDVAALALQILYLERRGQDS